MRRILYFSCTVFIFSQIACSNKISDGENKKQEDIEISGEKSEIVDAIPTEKNLKPDAYDSGTINNKALRTERDSGSYNGGYYNNDTSYVYQNEYNPENYSSSSNANEADFYVIEVPDQHYSNNENYYYQEDNYDDNYFIPSYNYDVYPYYPSYYPTYIDNYYYDKNYYYPIFPPENLNPYRPHKPHKPEYPYKPKPPVEKPSYSPEPPLHPGKTNEHGSSQRPIPASIAGRTRPDNTRIPSPTRVQPEPGIRPGSTGGNERPGRSTIVPTKDNPNNTDLGRQREEQNAREMENARRQREAQEQQEQTRRDAESRRQREAQEQQEQTKRAAEARQQRENQERQEQTRRDAESRRQREEQEQQEQTRRAAEARQQRENQERQEQTRRDAESRRQREDQERQEQSRRDAESSGRGGRR